MAAKVAQINRPAEMEIPDESDDEDAKAQHTYPRRRRYGMPYVWYIGLGLHCLLRP
ncbi:hypothetical protein B0T16DRAFT_8157 [Cercophora newfieldiana]|uniref:Uncharacterized protein n=1 Tax=Cercophora newfieldiana TaxID=92897 RepID=A0AA39YMH1_9PEZI|nr:hypothetical protein B0T16DRAFT_8157 [Cercophora newfieldiana]